MAGISPKTDIFTSEILMCIVLFNLYIIILKSFKCYTVEPGCTRICKKCTHTHPYSCLSSVPTGTGWEYSSNIIHHVVKQTNISRFKDTEYNKYFNLSNVTVAIKRIER